MHGALPPRGVATLIYPDRSEIQVGDQVRFEQAGRAGEVVAVIAEDLADYGVTEPGVMLKAAAGLVFLPETRFAGQALALAARGKGGFRWSGP